MISELRTHLTADISALDNYLRLAEHHAQQSPAFSECLESQFPNPIDMIEFQCFTEGLFDMHVVVTPSKAFRSFMQDLIND